MAGSSSGVGVPVIGFVMIGVLCYLLGAWGVTALLPTLIGLTLITNHRRKVAAVKTRHRGWLVRNAHRHRFVETLGFEVPRWLDFSTTEQCNWMRTMVAQLWPYTKVGVEASVREALEAALSAACPPLLSSLTLRRFRMGSTPPKITGMNTVETEQGISVDCTMHIGGNSDVIIEGASGPVVVPVELSNLVISGVLRVTFAALSKDVVPGFKAVSVSFARKPVVTFNLKAGEIPLTSIPGLDHAINYTVQEELADAMVWPKSVFSPLFDSPCDLTPEETADLTDMSGIGVLRVVVVGAENLDRPTLLRTADPYVVCSLNGSAKQQTYSEQATSNPTWHQPFEWITYDWATSEITFEVKDTGILTGIVKSLGRVSLDIASLQPLKTRRLRLPLRYNEKASKAHISVEVCYHQFLDVRPGSPSRLCRFNPTKRWAAAYVHVEVLSCTGLDEEEEVKLALICNKVTNTTGEVQNDVPVEQSFFFPLENLNTPVTVTLDPPNRLGRARIDLVDSEGKLKFGTKPTKATCSLVSYDKTVVVNLMVCVKVVQEKSDDKLIVDFYEHDSEVPKGDFQAHIPELVGHDDSNNRPLIYGSLTALVTVPYLVGLTLAHHFTGIVVAIAIGAVHVSLILKQEQARLIKAATASDTDSVLDRPESPAGTDDAISEAEMPNTGRATAATRCFQLDEAQMAEVLHMLPKWMTRPDVEKSDWFNDILVLLWPYLRPGVEAQIKAAIDMKADGPYSPFTKVEECFLGSHPPMVTGIKCYPECPRGSNIILDFNVCCFDDLSVVVRTGIGPASTTVQINDLFLECLMRIELGPPHPALPPFENIKVSFLNDFKIDLSVLIAGIPITSIPGVPTLIDTQLQRVLKPSVMAPNGIDIPIIVSKGTVADERGIGLLRVHIRRAIDLPDVNMFKSLEAYCTVQIHNVEEDGAPEEVQQHYTTRVRSRTINPVWDDTVEFLVKSEATTFSLKVNDTDIMGNESILGQVREIVIAKELGENVRTRCSLGLASPTSNQGTLQADLEWKPFVSALGVIHRPTSADNNLWSVGAVFVNITSCQSVGTRTDLGTPVSYITVDVGGVAKRTRNRKGFNPAFNSMFHFPISYVAMQKVNVRLMNHADRTTLGTYSFNISDVANSGGSLAGSWPLENSNSAVVDLDIMFRPVSMSDEGQSSFTIAGDRRSQNKMRQSRRQLSAPSTPTRPVGILAEVPNQMAGLAEAFADDAGLNLATAAAGIAWSRMLSP